MKRPWHSEDDALDDNPESSRRRDAHSQYSVGPTFPESQISRCVLRHHNLYSSSRQVNSKMGSPSPAATKLSRESPTTRAGPHRRTSSVTSSCVSLESGDQDVQSPARSTVPGKSPVATCTSSPRTPAGVNPGEKSVSPAAMKKRRSSIGGTDDLVRGLDFSTSSSPVNEEKKLHSFLAKGGGHKKVAQPASVTIQASSPGKKRGTTPPGKEKLVAVRASLTSVLSPRKLSDGREVIKKDISSPRKPVLASEGSSMNGTTTANSETGNNAESVTRKTPLRVSVDGKIGKSSPRLNTKSKSELVSTKGRTTSNDDKLTAINSSVDQAETKTDFKFSSGVSLEGKIGKKSSPRPSLNSNPSLTSSSGRKMTKSRQDTPSPPQLGRVKTGVDKAARNGELSRPEMESVEVPIEVYSEYEHEREAKFENVVNMSHKMSAPLQHREAGEERSSLLASLMVGGNVGDEDMSSLERGVEQGFENDTELPTSWLSEDLPCMFSSLSHLPEPDDSSSSLFGDPPEVLDESFQGSSNGNLLAVPNDVIFAEIARNVVVSSPQSSPLIMDEKIVTADNLSEVSNGLHQRSVCDSAWKYETNSLSNIVDDPVDKFEAELRTQIDAAHESESPHLSISQVEDPVDDFEAELRTQIDATYEQKSHQLLVPPAGQEYVVPVAIFKPSLAVDKRGKIPHKITTHPQVRSSSTSDNESSVTEGVANETFPQSCSIQVTDNMLTVEDHNHEISSQIVRDPTERSQVASTYVEGDEEIFQLDPPSCTEQMISVSNADSTLQDEGRRSTVEDRISNFHSSPSQHVVESSDDELMEELIEDSNSAQLNLKQSFDDVAESLAVSRSRVDEIVISYPNTVDTLPVDMVVPKEDVCKNALEQQTVGPKELAYSSESEFATEFLDEQDREVFTPTNLDQDMRIFDEYWTQSVADDFSQSDAGQNDAEEEQPSTLSETQFLNTVEDEAEKSLPPIELPVSILPVVGKLKFTVEEFANIEPPDQSSANVGATKLQIVDIIEETLPREDLPCPDSTESLSASDNYQIEVESSNKELEEFDEVFHLFGGSKELNTSVFSLDNLSSPLRPNALPEDLIQEPLDPSESFEETTFVKAGESDANVSLGYTASIPSTKHPHVIDTAQVVLDVQNRDLEGVTEHQNFSIEKFAVQDASVDDLPYDPHHASSSGALHGPADEKPIHEDLGTPPVLSVTSNGLLGVNIQHLGNDDASDECVIFEDLDLPKEDPDLSLSTTIQDNFLNSSFETPPMSEAHVMTVQSNEVLELDVEIPSMLEGVEFYGNSLQSAGGGDENAAPTENAKNLISDDCTHKINNIQSSSNRDFSGLIVEVATETNDSHDLDSEISPKLPVVERNQTILVSQSNSSADAASEEVDRSESNAPFPPVNGIKDEEQNEANLWSSSDKGKESLYAAVLSDDHVDGAVTDVERHERVELDSFHVNGDDEFQDDERLSTSALQIVVESHRDVNISEVDHEPHIFQLILSQVSETLENSSTEDETPDYVTTDAVDKSLPVVLDESNTHILSVACSPTCNEEDDTVTDKFDSKSEVNSTVSLDMVIPGTEVIINDTGTASSTEILEKDEESHIIAAPFELSAKGLSNVTLDEAGEFDTHESECEVNEENILNEDHSKRGIVDFGDQSRAQLDWEGPILTADSSGSRSSIEDKSDMLCEESMFRNSSCSVVADEKRGTKVDLEIDQDESEKRFSIIQSSASTPSELIEHHNHNLQMTHLPLGTLASTDDQISPTEASPEQEKSLNILSDAGFDEDRSEAASEDHVIEDVETIPENCSSQDSRLKLFVISSQDTLNVENSESEIVMEDPDLSWKGKKLEGESLNEILEQSCQPKDVGVVVDSPEKKFVVSDQDTETTVDVDEWEEDSSFSSKTKRENVVLNGRLEEEPFIEDEETVVFSPKISCASPSGPDSEILGANNIENQSNVSWIADKNKGSSNGRVQERSLLEDEDTVVYSPKDTSDATSLGAINIQDHSAASLKVDSEEYYTNENLEVKTFLKDEDMAVDSTKSPFVISGQITTILDDSELEGQSNTSWTSDKNDEGLNGSLERDFVLEDEEMVVPNLKDSFNDSVQETPSTKISVVNIQNHSNISWTADKDELESINRSLKSEESLLKDEDTVVYRPMESFVASRLDLPDTAPFDDDKVEEHLKFLEKADMEERSLRSIVLEEAMPEVEESMPEVQETAVGNHVETLVVQSNSNAEDLIVDVVEKHPTWSDDEEEEESLNRDILARESLVEVQEMEENPIESIVVPDSLNTSAESLDVDETEEYPSCKTHNEEETLIQSLDKSMFQVEETAVGSPKVTSVISDHKDVANAAISDAGEFEKDSVWAIDKEREGLNRNLKEESVLEVQETMMNTSSNGNMNHVLVCQTVPELNGATCESKNSNTDYMGECLMSHSRTEDGALAPHESDLDAVHTSMDAVRVENYLPLNTDNVDEDSDLGKSNRVAAVVDCKSCEVPQMINGNDLHEPSCLQETASSVETSVLAVKTEASSLEPNLREIDYLEEATEPQSPEATLYPILASQTPFSGSQQDRLWEEQAEAYSSGGRGTPSRNEDATQAAAPFLTPTSPGEQPTTSDDQIQPASVPMSSGHAVAGPSHGAGENGISLHEPKGKTKLHTPLRSLLLEDASKSTDGDTSTPNSVISSPSFIRRLFRVMSTPSRSADRDVSQTKLKKTSSMWVSCLGSPQVQQ